MPYSFRVAVAVLLSVVLFPLQVARSENVEMETGVIEQALEETGITLEQPTGTEATAENSQENSSYRKILNDYWQQQHTYIIGFPGQVWNGYYPSPPTHIPLSGWLIEGNAVWKEDAERQLQFVHRERTNADGFILGPTYPNLTRDGVAREGIFIYMSYQLLQNPDYLAWVDTLAVSMMNKLKRSPRSFRGKTYELFYAEYEKIPPYRPIGLNAIDPNQNAEIGLLFTMLYHEPNSVLYHNKVAKKIAYDELSASMALQEPTGELSLTEMLLGQYDTGYGSYTAMLWTMANKYWNDNAFQKHITLAGQWLSQWMSADRLGEHFWPEYTFNQPWSTELWWRLAVYRESNIDVSQYVLLLYQQQWLDPSAIVTLYLSGVPFSTYLLDFSPALCLDVPLAGETPNSIRNPGFECDLAGSWKVNNATQDTKAYRGSFSLRIGENGKKDWEEYASQENLRVLPKTTYKFKAVTRASSGLGAGVVKINLYDSQRTLLTSKRASFNSSVFWRRVTVSFSTPKNTSYAEVILYNRSGTKNRSIYLDALSLSR